MSSKFKCITTAISFFLIFTITQVYVGVSFAGPNAGSSGIPLAGPILTTRGNQPITVNGASAISGATILSGATIETPDQVGATINLGSLGTLDIAPNTKLALEFDQNGNVKVTLVQGCVILRTEKKAAGEIDTSQGVAGKTDPATGGLLDVCFPQGATAPTVNQGAAASAGAGAGAGGAAGAATAAGGAAGGGGISTTAVVLIGAIGEGALITTALVVPCTRGNNPSPELNTQCR